MQKNKKKVKIICEIGLNHNGKYRIAKQMTDVAIKAGADIIKFQVALPENVKIPNAPLAQYQKKNMGKKLSSLNMSKKFHLNFNEIEKLKKFIEKKKKLFLASAFDIKSLQFIKKIGCNSIKIPSGEINNFLYLEFCSKNFKTIYLSTGMSTFLDVQKAIKVLNKNIKKKIYVLQCNTEYPSPYKDINLRAMINMGKKLKLDYGLSDHSLGIECSIAAVALEAKVIEKHFTLDKNMFGADHICSINPNEFKTLVNSIRNIELALGEKTKKVTASEYKNKKVVRKGVYFLRDINKNKKIKISDIGVLRPENSFSPFDVKELIGKKVKKQFKKFNSVNKKYISK